MSTAGLTYAVITPARNEAANLPRLAMSLATQTTAPYAWIIVDDGSTDGTRMLAEDLAEQLHWVTVVQLEPKAGRDEVRGGTVVRAFTAGLKALDAPPDIVVKVDGDVSMGTAYFTELLGEFAADDRLGIASGTAHELHGGVWRARFTTGTGVWGAARAYRWECLRRVLPLEERMGWDGIDEHKAQSAGWSTKAILSLPFYHHRKEGERDGSRVAAWMAQGNVAHYVHYRPSYLLLRSFFRAVREPAALAMLAGYAAAVVRREARCADEVVRGRVRAQQRLRMIPRRLREALGRSDNNGEAPLSAG